MMDKKQVNDVVRQNVALLSKLSEQEVGMMPAGSGEADHYAGQAYHLPRLFQ